MKSRDEINKEYEDAIVGEIAKKMKGAGFHISNGKVIGTLIGIIFALIGIVYGSLVSADANMKSDIGKLQSDYITTGQTIQNMANNIYLLCESSKTVNCIKPESFIK